MKNIITILFLFCSILSFGQISAARKLLLAQEYKYPILAEMGSDNYVFASSITVDLPSNKEVGDLVVISVHGTSNQLANINTPTGWTRLSIADRDVDLWHAIYYKFITVSDGSSVSITSTYTGYKFAKSFLYKNASTIDYVSQTGVNSTTYLARSMTTHERALACWHGVIFGTRYLTSYSSPGVVVTSNGGGEYLQLMTLSYSSSLGLGIKEGKINWIDGAYSNMVLFEIRN